MKKLSHEELIELLDKFGALEPSTLTERSAHNYLIEELEAYPIPETLEGERLYGLCVGILRDALDHAAFAHAMQTHEPPKVG